MYSFLLQYDSINLYDYDSTTREGNNVYVLEMKTENKGVLRTTGHMEILCSRSMLSIKDHEPENRRQTHHYILQRHSFELYFNWEK